MPHDRRWFSPPLYGLPTYGDLFTPRQLVALTTFADLVGEARAQVERDAIVAGLPDDSTPLRDGGTGATAYAEAVGVYLAFALDKAADYWSQFVLGTIPGRKSATLLVAKRSRWSGTYAEGKRLLRSTGRCSGWRWWTGCGNVLLFRPPQASGSVCSSGCLVAQSQSCRQGGIHRSPLLRQHRLRRPFGLLLRLAAPALRPTFPDLFATLAVPKAEELVATPYRHGGTRRRRSPFSRRHDGGDAPSLPSKRTQGFRSPSTTPSSSPRRKGTTGTSSTGWETFLDAVIEVRASRSPALGRCARNSAIE